MKDDILAETLVTGAGGMVGSYIDFGIKLDHAMLDITDVKSVEQAFKKYKPKAVVHLAALTDVDLCEKDPARAYQVNSVGAYHVALAARNVGASMVYVSTAGVFDGTKRSPYSEHDLPNPQNYYGHSKYLGELAVANTLENHVIVRVCWMMGGGPAQDKKFVAKIMRQLNDPAVSEIKAVTDQIGSPTFGKDLVGAIKQLLATKHRGIVHSANTGSASRYDVARSMVEILNKKTKVTGVPSSYFNLPAVRPQNEVLVSSLDLMRPWEEALRAYLTSEWK